MRSQRLVAGAPRRVRREEGDAVMSEGSVVLLKLEVLWLEHVGYVSNTGFIVEQFSVASIFSEVV